MSGAENLNSIDPIDPDSLSQAGLVKYREKRLGILNLNDSFVVISDRNFNESTGAIKNVSRFGTRILLNDEGATFIIGEQLPRVKLTLLGTQIYNGPATIVNEQKAVQKGFELGLSLYGEGIDLDQVNAILQIEPDANSIGSIKGVIELSKQVLPDFKILVADLNTLFSDLRMKLHDEEKRIAEFATSPSHNKRLEQQAINVAFSLYEHDIQNIFEDFDTLITTLRDADAIEIHKRYFRTNFHAHFLNAPFIHRAYHKPLGYAGDFELLVMLYDYQDLGPTLFEKFFHRMGCHTPSAVANKNRVVFLADLILREYSNIQRDIGTFLVTSVACGAGREIQLFLEDVIQLGLMNPIKTICLDKEERALEYGQIVLRKTIKPGFPIESIFLAEDVINGLIQPSHFKKELSGSHLISCASLFDYLSDRVATKLIEAMFELLAPGGSLFIGAVSDTSPDRFLMDFLMEWKLKLRSAEDLKRIVPEKIRGLPHVIVEVISEPLGLNLILRVRKPSL
ncbi:MAG: hypothetical protein H7249_04280 [Chitinophagaceae bacterium]|nr:hypothetical protein [Oligoflexus sp.]